MTTITLTLADFLLARYGELERDLDPNADTWMPVSWWEADIAAKRRIVELHQRSVRAVGEGLSAQTRAVLFALASVYSDHPDYRSEWAS